MSSRGWVLGLAAVVLVSWWWWRRPSTVQIVAQSLEQMQRAQTFGQRQQRDAAIQAMMAPGPNAVAALTSMLKVGTRRRRMAIQALLLASVRRGGETWRRAVWAAMWGAMKHDLWRVREVALSVLLAISHDKTSRHRVWKAGLADAHPYLRFLTIKALQREKSLPSELLQPMLAWLAAGQTTSKSHDTHAHNHPDTHGRSPIQSTHALKQHLRERLTCRVDRDDDWPLRYATLGGIGRWPLPAHRKAALWISALDDRHPGVRKEAYRQLLQHKQLALPSLVTMVKGAKTPKKHMAATILGDMGPLAAKPLLALFRQPDPGIWYAAARGLRRLGSQGKQVVASLCQIMHKGAAVRGKEAASILARIGLSAWDCLHRQLHASNKPLQRAATRSLGLMAKHLCHKPKSPSCQQLAHRLVPALVRRLDGSKSAPVTLWALGQMHEAASSALPSLLAPLPSQQPTLRPKPSTSQPPMPSSQPHTSTLPPGHQARQLPRHRARQPHKPTSQPKRPTSRSPRGFHQWPAPLQGQWLIALARIGGFQPSVQTRLPGLLRDPMVPSPAKIALLRGWAMMSSANVHHVGASKRSGTSTALVRKPGTPKRSLPAHGLAQIIGLFDAPSRRLRMAASSFLVAWQRPGLASLVRQLLQSLASNAHHRRREVVRVLAQWHHWPPSLAARGAKALAYRCLHDPSTATQIDAAAALTHIGPAVKDGISPTQWHQLLTHPRWQVRMWTARTLATLSHRAAFAVPALRKALTDPKRQVRRDAAFALGRIGAAAGAASPQLRQAMGDHAIDVQHAAKRALALIHAAQKHADSTRKPSPQAP